MGKLQYGLTHSYPVLGMAGRGQFHAPSLLSPGKEPPGVVE